MPNTKKPVPLSREMNQRESETTEMSLMSEKGKRAADAKSLTGRKSATDKQAGTRKGHQ